MAFEDIVQVALIVIGLLLVWGVLGLIFKLAQRVISCGCSLILGLGLLYVLLHWFNFL